MKVKRSYLLSAIVIASFSITAVFFFSYFKENRDSRRTTLLEEEGGARAPASILNYYDFKVAHDYLNIDSLNKRVKQEIDVAVWTDVDKKYFGKKFTNILHEVLAKTIAYSGPESLGIILKKSFMKSFIDNFLKTIYFYKIINGNFQIDLLFNLKSTSLSDFSSQLESNQIIQMSQKGNLGKQVFSDDISFVDKIKLTHDIPSNGKLYQYVGGVISLSFTILDFNWNPFKPIPNPKANAVKGTVRFRRYYRLNNPTQLASKWQTEDGYREIEFKPAKIAKKQYATVDLQHNFNLENPIPARSTMTVYPGQIRKTDIVKRGFVSRLLDWFGKKDYVSGRFYLEVEKRDEDDLISSPLIIPLKSIVYNFKKKKWGHTLGPLRPHGEEIKNRFKLENFSSEL